MGTKLKKWLEGCVQCTAVHSQVMSEKICFKWNEFQNITESAFRTLRKKTDFSDVTLACEDGDQVEAHKVILAASSPFFQNLLRRNKHPHPLIYMRGVKSEDLMAIVDFLYYGEASISQENLAAFLAIGEELGVKGISENEFIEQIEENFSDSIETSFASELLEPKVENIKISENEININEQIDSESTETRVAINVVSKVNITDIQDLEEKVGSMMKRSQNLCYDGKQKAHICAACGKEGKKSNIKDHIESNHLDGVSIPCNFCINTFRTRRVLKHHIIKHHK